MIDKYPTINISYYESTPGSNAHSGRICAFFCGASFNKSEEEVGECVEGILLWKMLKSYNIGSGVAGGEDALGGLGGVRGLHCDHISRLIYKYSIGISIIQAEFIYMKYYNCMIWQ